MTALLTPIYRDCRRRPRLHWWHGLSICALLWQPGFAVAEGRFTLSPDGTQVTDGQTGLTWRRCSEGQAFSAGTCINLASSFTYQAALAHAKTQTGWRLPNVKELSSLLVAGGMAPTIDLTVFPATPSAGCWSTSPTATMRGYVWFVTFGEGRLGYGDRDTHKNHIRLVR